MRDASGRARWVSPRSTMCGAEVRIAKYHVMALISVLSLAGTGLWYASISCTLFSVKALGNVRYASSESYEARTGAPFAYE